MCKGAAAPLFAGAHARGGARPLHSHRVARHGSSFPQPRSRTAARHRPSRNRLTARPEHPGSSDGRPGAARQAAEGRWRRSRLGAARSGPLRRSCPTATGPGGMFLLLATFPPRSVPCRQRRPATPALTRATPRRRRSSSSRPGVPQAAQRRQQRPSSRARGMGQRQGSRRRTGRPQAARRRRRSTQRARPCPTATCRCQRWCPTTPT